MSQEVIRKLETSGTRTSRFDAEDRALLLAACDDVRSFKNGRDIAKLGDLSEHVYLMIDGWACRYKVLRNGSRQIISLLVPGDFSDVHTTGLDLTDDAIAALCACRVAFISRSKMRELAARPTIGNALDWASQVNEAILRAWIVNLGRRDAYSRVGHLFCELHARLSNVGLTYEGRFELPLTQDELADTLGLTSVHVNRTLKRMRDEGLIALGQRRLVIADIERLQHIVGFDPRYLHLPSGVSDETVPMTLDLNG